MQVPLKIGYHHVIPSEALEAVVRAKASELEKFFDRITRCQVSIERPGAHHRKGKGAHYRVRIELTVPGQVLVVGRDPAKTRTHEDAYLAVNEGFRAARRQLQDYLRRMRGQVKAHALQPHARVSRVFHDRGYGFLETADGREVYFNKSSVLNGDFERLKKGSDVRFVEELGDEGPQASTVRALAAKPQFRRRRAEETGLAR